MMNNNQIYITTNPLTVGESVSGEPIQVMVINVTGYDSSAPTAYIQANIHGAEVQGNAVIYQLLEEFKVTQPRGNVTLVPYCNPIGLNNKSGEYTQGRFDSATGQNWNRQYYYSQEMVTAFANQHAAMPSSEIATQFREHLLLALNNALEDDWQLTRSKYLAYSLQRLASQADSVLDLHTASNAVPYLYAPNHAVSSTQYFICEYVIGIDNVFTGALDEACSVPWTKLTELLQSQYQLDFINPVQAFTLELGSQETISLAQAMLQANGILAYLAHRGTVHTCYKPALLNQHVYSLDQLVSYYAPWGGLYEFTIAPGQAVAKGEVFAHCLQLNNVNQAQVVKQLRAPFDGVLLSCMASSAVPRGLKLADFAVTS